MFSFVGRVKCFNDERVESTCKLFEEGCDKSDEELAYDISTSFRRLYLEARMLVDRKELIIWDINNIEELMLIEEFEAIKSTLEQLKGLATAELKSNEELIQFLIENDERMLKIQNSKGEEKSEKIIKLVGDMYKELKVNWK